MTKDQQSNQGMNARCSYPTYLERYALRHSALWRLNGEKASAIPVANKRIWDETCLFSYVD